VVVSVALFAGGGRGGEIGVAHCNQGPVIIIKTHDIIHISFN
jgi:hypothetical protein